MMTLVIGNSNSGKSALAEQMCLETGDERRYYLATMRVLDSEGESRVRRHRSMREGKGFVTLEKPLSVDGVLREMTDPEHATVLLECVANLVGNKMHEADPAQREARATDTADINAEDTGIADINAEDQYLIDCVAAEILRLSAGVHHLVAVTDDYPAEDPQYDEETKRYVRLLKLVNARLIKAADRVVDLRDLRQDPEGTESS